MRFNGWTVLAGGVRSRRRHDTTALVPAALAVCRVMLGELRRGLEFAAHPFPDLPAFGVSLGVPELIRAGGPGVAGMGEGVEHVGRYFCVAAPGEHPFSINLVLPARERGDDVWAVATLLGISRGTSGGPGYAGDSDVEAAAAPFLRARPLLATAVLPVTLDAALIRVGADFATCFAAALLTEDEDAENEGDTT